MTEPTVPIWTGDDLNDEEFLAVVELLRRRRQFDLGQYKDRCVRRRIAKRLRSSGALDMASYLERLQHDDDELDTLLATLSIHVSQFFRNPDTFLVLERDILPDLCHRARTAGRKQLRIWSAGCAGGEEAYSLALLIDELAPTDLEVSILATDISEPVLASARQGLFEPTRLTEVPKAVIDRYFLPEAGRFRLIERIRRMVRFERHNIMTASAYPAADLILCRNVLIYFSRAEQQQIIARFAAALPESGALVLGRAETMSEAGRQLFRVEFPVERIYRRAAATAADAVQTPASGSRLQGAE